MFDNLLPGNDLFFIGKTLLNYKAEMVFSLGEALTALGLFFTMYQLKSKSWEIALSVRGYLQQSLFWIACGMGILIPLVTFLLKDHLNQTVVTVTGIIAFCLFVCASSFLYYCGSYKSALFTRKRAKNFFEVLSKKIADSESGHLEVPVDMIESNIVNIVSALKHIKTTASNEPLTPQQEYASWAECVLRLLICDTRVANYIVKYRLPFLVQLLDQLKKNNIQYRFLSLDIKSLFEQLFQEKHSYLYKQLDNRSIDVMCNLYLQIFQDYYFVCSVKALGGAQTFSINENNDRYLDVFFTALENALRGNWNTISHAEMQPEIVEAFLKIEQYMCGYTNLIIANPKNDKAWHALHKIAFFLGTAYIGCYKNAEEKILADQKKIDLKNPHNLNINSAYAKCVYFCIESLARIANSSVDEKENIESSLNLTAKLLVNEKIMHDASVSFIRDSIIQMIWKKIDGDAHSDIQGYFPSVLSVYLNIIGSPKNEEAPIYSQERKKLSTFLYAQVKPKIVNEELMIDKKTTFEAALLPKSVQFNRTTQQFEYALHGGKRIVFDEKEL